MIASMTAFAEVETEDWIWEVRTVNHRFLDMSFKLPDRMLKLEREFREIAKTKLHRGKMDASLRFVGTRADSQVEVNDELLAQLLHAVATAEKRSVANGIGESRFSVNVVDVLKWPGVLNAVSDTSEEMESAVLTGFGEALNKIQEVRLNEGKALSELFKDRLNAINQILSDIQLHSLAQSEYVRRRLIERIERFQIEIDDGRIAQEVAISAQKADIGEECDRLRVHIEEFEKCLESPGSLGRHMGFLVQEMAREANTLAAKTVLQECINTSVELKVLIDQIREQVQNVE